MVTGGIGLSSKGMDTLASPNSQKNKKNTMNLGNKNAAVIAELRKGKGLLGSVGAIISPHGGGASAAGGGSGGRGG